MSENNISGEQSIIEERRKKLNFLREKNKAYINDFLPKNLSSEIHKDYQNKSKQDLEKNIVEGLQVVGRIILKRVMGNASFVTIRDRSGEIQIYISKNTIEQDLYEDFKTWDLGDIVGFVGKLFRTRTDELTIEANQAVMITKSIRPMPDKHKGLSDIETRYRQRYLDLMSNDESRKVFLDRTKIISSLRDSLIKKDFLEVETPMMHPIPGGAVARPFVTKHNSLDRELFLRIAPELYLKRLLVGGFDRVFEINRSFRNEGLSTKHNPEFTMLEYYEAYSTLERTMEFTADMIKHACKEVNNSLQIKWGDNDINLEHFEKKNLADLVMEYNNLSSNDLDSFSGKELLEKFEETVEDKLIQPTFVVGYPVDVSPLSRRNNDNPEIADRFELFISGKEIANGFCELNDPDDQSDRFKEQVKAKDSGDNEAMSYDDDYIIALEHGMPPAVGVGVGIDRLVMLITNQSSIRDVLLFPQMKSL
jgi:lysyl-tRNA synthetase class 2